MGIGWEREAQRREVERTMGKQGPESWPPSISAHRSLLKSLPEARGGAQEGCEGVGESGDLALL